MFESYTTLHKIPKMEMSKIFGFNVPISNSMNTIQEYDENMTILDLYDLNFHGILDLIKFTKLEELDCSRNYITKIINIPNSVKKIKYHQNYNTLKIDKLPDNLEELVCSFNNIVNLSNLPLGLKKLNCSDNNIVELNNLPNLLEELDCSYCRIINLNNLPLGLKKLNCSFNIIFELNNLPDSLEELDCSYNNIVNLSNLSSSLKKLNCFNNKIIELNNLPNLLEELDCSNNKIINLNYLPLNLKKLNCLNNNLLELNNLPNILEELNCSNNLIQNLDNLPSSLKILKCRHNIFGTLNNLPINLEYLNCYEFHIKMLDKNKFKNLKINDDLIKINNLISKIAIENSKYIDYVEQKLKLKTDEIFKINNLQTKYMETKLEEHYNDIILHIMSLIKLKELNIIKQKYMETISEEYYYNIICDIMSLIEFKELNIYEQSNIFKQSNTSGQPSILDNFIKFYSMENNSIQKIIIDAINMKLNINEISTDINELKIKTGSIVNYLQILQKEIDGKNEIMLEITKNDVLFLKNKINNINILRLYHLTTDKNLLNYEDKNEELDKINKKLIKLDDKLKNPNLNLNLNLNQKPNHFFEFYDEIKKKNEMENESKIKILLDVCLFYGKKIY